MKKTRFITALILSGIISYMWFLIGHNKAKEDFNKKLFKTVYFSEFEEQTKQGITVVIGVTEKGYCVKN